MKKVFLMLVASCFALFTSCQTKNKTKTTGSTQTGTEVKSQGEVKIKYRAVVSFGSKGTGIDGPKYEAVQNFVKNHAKKPAYDEIQRGREGERSFCFLLKEMNSDEQKAFVEELRKLVQGGELVGVEENVERVKKQ